MNNCTPETGETRYSHGKACAVLDMRVLSVRQLIEKLQAMPPDWPVIAEGCDCHGGVTDLFTYEAADAVSVVVLETTA